jgi:hypothetical protein
MPTDDRLGLDDHHGIQNTWREPIEGGKNEPVEIGEGKPFWRFSLQHTELMALRHDLRLERGV